MAMTSCKECGKDTSQKASAYPHYGAPVRGWLSGAVKGRGLSGYSLRRGSRHRRDLPRIYGHFHLRRAYVACGSPHDRATSGNRLLDIVVRFKAPPPYMLAVFPERSRTSPGRKEKEEFLCWKIFSYSFHCRDQIAIIRF